MEWVKEGRKGEGRGEWVRLGEKGNREHGRGESGEEKAWRGGMSKKRGKRQRVDWGTSGRGPGS